MVLAVLSLVELKLFASYVNGARPQLVDNFGCDSNEDDVFKMNNVW